MGQKILGLDIQFYSVSAVLITSGIKGSRIEAHAQISMTDQGDLSAQLATALEALQKEIDLSGAVCLAAFPADDICYRNIKIPFKEQKKIGLILPFELEPHIPFQIDDCMIDFYPINRFESPNETEILAAVIEKARLKSYTDILASFNIEPEIISPGAYAAASCVAEIYDLPADSFVLDIAKNICSLFAVVSGQVCLARSISLRKGSPLRLAELCLDIERTVVGFKDTFPIDFQPQGVILTGFDINEGDIDETLQHKLNLPIMRADLLQKTEAIVSVPAGEPWESGKMNNALALALMRIKGIKGINFRKSAFATQRVWRDHKAGIIKSAVLAGLVLALFMAGVALDSFWMQKKAHILDRQIKTIFTTTFPDVKKIVDPLQQMRVKIRERKKKAGFIHASGDGILKIDILNEISTRIPKNLDVEFTRLVMGPQRVTISGITDRFNAVDDLKTGLEQIPFFQKVKMGSTKKDPVQNRVRFKMNVEL